VYECRVSDSRNFCECFVLITYCFNCSVSNCCYLLNPWASLLQYVCKHLVLEIQSNNVLTLYPLNFSVLGYLKTLVYSAVIKNEEIPCQHIFDAYQTICNCPRTFEQVRQSMIMYDHMCIYLGGEHLEHLSNCVLINNKIQHLLNWECLL
jgi:hypothetical protein